MSHSTPKIAPLSGAQPSMIGVEPGWVLIPTRTGQLGGLLASDREDNSPTTLKWGFGPGVPTPDPALLLQHGMADDGSQTTLKWNLGEDNGSPTTLKWNYPPGVPTPDPALLIEIAGDDGSPTTLKWNLGEGVPTPDPANLVDNGSPTTLKWSFPDGEPTPDPALLVGVPDTIVWEVRVSIVHLYEFVCSI